MSILQVDFDARVKGTRLRSGLQVGVRGVGGREINVAFRYTL